MHAQRHEALALTHLFYRSSLPHHVLTPHLSSPSSFFLFTHQHTPTVLGNFVPNIPLGIGNWTVVTDTADGSQITTLSEYGWLYMSYDYGATWESRPEIGTQHWTSGEGLDQHVVSAADRLPNTILQTKERPALTYLIYTFRIWDDGHDPAQTAHTSYHGDKIIAVTHDGGVFTTTDHGVSKSCCTQWCIWH